MQITLTTRAGARHPGHLALPEGDGPFPAVVVLHDISGVRADTRRHCARFVEAGYAALAPDLYAGSASCVVKTLLASVRYGPTPAPIEAARAHLAGLPQVDAARIGVVGFCLGGGFALLAGADHEFAVAAPFYGPVPRSEGRLSGLCPTIGQIGARDMIYASHGRRLQRHLESLGIEHELHLYDEGGHSFMNDHFPDGHIANYSPMRARYQPELEERAWGALVAFFDRVLKPGA